MNVVARPTAAPMDSTADEPAQGRVAAGSLDARMWVEGRWLPVEVIVLGGVLNHASAEFNGPALRAGLEGLRATIAFLGADGLTVVRGAQTATASAAESARLLARHTKRRGVLADASKLGRDSFTTYLDADNITTVITAGTQDERAQKECRRLRKRGIQIIDANELDTKGMNT